MTKQYRPKRYKINPDKFGGLEIEESVDGLFCFYDSADFDLRNVEKERDVLLVELGRLSAGKVGKTKLTASV